MRAISRVAIAIWIGKERDRHTADTGVARIVIVRISEHRATDGAGLFLDEVIAGVRLTCGQADRNAIVCRAGVCHVIARSGGVAIGGVQIARGLGLDDHIVSWSQAGEAVFTGAVRGRGGADLGTVGGIAIAVRIGEERDRHTTDADIAVVIIVRVGQDRAADRAGGFFNEVVARVSAACGDGDRTNLIQIATILICHAERADGLGFQHAIDARRHVAEGVTAIGGGGGRDRLHACGHRVAIDRITAAVHQGECDARDTDVAIVVVVRIGKDGARDAAGQFFDEVIAGITFGGSDGDGNSIVSGAAVRHIVARCGAVDIGDGQVARRLSFHHDVSARSKVREAVAAIGNGRCWRTHGGAVGRIAVAIRVGEQGDGDGANACVARVVVVRVSQHGAADGTGLFFDEVVAAVGLACGDRDRNAIVRRAGIGHVVAWRGAVAIGHVQVAAGLGFHDDVVARWHIGEGVAAIGGGCRR